MHVITDVGVWSCPVLHGCRCRQEDEGQCGAGVLGAYTMVDLEFVFQQSVIGS